MEKLEQFPSSGPEPTGVCGRFYIHLLDKFVIKQQIKLHNSCELSHRFHLKIHHGPLFAPQNKIHNSQLKILPAGIMRSFDPKIRSQVTKGNQ